MEKVKEKMSERVIAQYGLGIQTLQDATGRLRTEIQGVNEGVPEEIVIMKMKKLLNKMEEEYKET